MDGEYTPLSVFSYLLDLSRPYLPSPVYYLLTLALKSINSLPPTVANFLPVLLAIFTLYTAVMSAMSTLRYAVRTGWFFMKWGGMAAALAYAFGLKIPGIDKYNTGVDRDGRPTGRGRGGGGGLTGNGASDYILHQAANMAGLPIDQIEQAAPGLLQDPLGALGQFVHFLSPDTAQTKTKRAKAKKQTRSNARDVDGDDVPSFGGMASKWAMGAAQQAWSALKSDNGGRGDGFAERRRERANQRGNVNR